jgi:hypothetical protein
MTENTHESSYKLASLLSCQMFLIKIDVLEHWINYINFINNISNQEARISIIIFLVWSIKLKELSQRCFCVFLVNLHNVKREGDCGFTIQIHHIENNCCYV